MPEVPELNLVGLTLQKRYKGQKIEGIEILWKKRVANSQQEFEKAIVGGTLLNVERNGKELHLHLNNGHTLGIHMMLTGSMHLLPSEDDIRYPIFKLYFKNGNGIVVADGMGQAKPILDPSIPNVPDIMGDDFTLDYFQNVVSKRTKAIKLVILDQTIIRGIGNAYADEILWHSGISPFSRANAIPEEKVASLYESIRDVTVEATEALERTKPNDNLFVMENYEHRFIHNPKKKISPDGQTILVGKLGAAKTYYTEGQLLYDSK